VQGDPPKHGFLGVSFAPASAPLTIQSVVQGSGAAEAGLQPGDVILAAGSTEKPDEAAMQRVVRASVPGQELLLKARRGLDEMEVRVKLISFTDLIVLSERERSGTIAP
jgi:S1-C subfamily serine protease